MKKQVFYQSVLSGVMTLATILSVGCAEEEPSMFTTERIVINCTSSVIDASNSSGSRTRSALESTKIGSSVLTSKTGKKMYLSCTETPWPVEKTTVTRGGKVATATIGTVGISASVYPVANSYTSAGCGSYFYKEAVTSGTPTNYYWPTPDYRISFFGYSPYNNAAFTVQSAANATGAPTYAYTVPSTISNQLDIMTGQDVDGGSSSPVNMTLAHRCSAIHFSITNDRSDAITVNSISIEGVKYTGTLNGSSWTLGGSVNSSSTNPFTLTYVSSVAAGATVDITGTSNIFMMLPQTLSSDTKLKVVVDDEEFETDLSGTWQDGKEYTYTIAMSEDTAIDLSMIDNAGNERTLMTTANCYLVHAAGNYKLPLVYGNAIKNGEVNTPAFNPGGETTSTYCANFVNHNDDAITGPWITKNGSGIDAGMNISAVSAELLWQDVSGLISAVSVGGDYLKFTVGTYAPGNALIAVKDGSGTILWSWHIWATEDDLSNTTVVATGSHNYTVAPVNLGWVPTGGSGKQGYCPYYQWGRKDPFIPCSGTANGNTNKTVYNISGMNITPAKIEASSTGIQYKSSYTVTIADNIKEPTCFYCNMDLRSSVTTTYLNMWDAQNMAMRNVTTATKKTVYDPCPPEFCVPTGNLVYFMSDSQKREMTTWDSMNYGATWIIGITGNALWFPATGCRAYDKGSLNDVGTLIYNYMATPRSETSGYNLFARNTTRYNYWYENGNNKSEGNAVRPVAEE